MRRATPPAAPIDRASRWTRLAVLAFVALLTSCKTTSVVLTFEADANLNPNSSGDSTPVTVRIYQLREKEPFTSVNFDKLWDREAGILEGTDIGAPSEVVVNQGESKKTEPIALAEATRFLGLMVEFTDPTGRSWQQCVSVEEAEAGAFVLVGSEITHQKEKQ